ncbi:MAG: hypothetical protein WD557_07665 [Dehalococcoidia bacterium]
MAEAGSSPGGQALRGWALPLSRPAAPTRAQLYELLTVSLAAMAAVGLLALRSNLMSPSNPIFAEPGWDHHAYIAMAEDNPFDFHLAPFGWRFLVPLVAAILPFSASTSFFLIAFASVAGATVAMYYLGLHAGESRAWGVVGALFFLALGWAAKFALVDYWLPDAAAFLAVALAVLWAIRRQPAAFAITLLVGVAAKEAVLFALPLWYTLQAQRLLDWRVLRETALVAIPALVLLVAVRVLIDARNDDLAYVATLPANLRQFREFIPAYNYLDLLRDIGWDIRAHDRTQETFLLYTTGTWGVPILTLAAIGAVRNPLLALRLSPFLLLVYAQLLFALNIERLLVFGFPAMIWLAIVGARALVDSPRDPRVVLVVALGACLVALNFRDPDSIPIGFELQTFLLMAFLALIVGLRVPLWRDAAAERSHGDPR